MSAGLDASTVTPGNTAPEVSLTRPASVACACAIAGSMSASAALRMTARGEQTRRQRIRSSLTTKIRSWGSLYASGDGRRQYRRCGSPCRHTAFAVWPAHIRDGDSDPPASARGRGLRRCRRRRLHRRKGRRVAGLRRGWTLDCTPLRRAMRHMRPAMSALLLAAIASIDAPVVLAQTQHGVLAGYTVTSWTLADGVPIGPINAIAQNADGYLWLGTTRGVVRFDGARFTPWEAIYSTRLPDAEVLALSGSRNRTLWVGFARTAGRVSVAALRNGKIVTVSEGVAPHDSTTAVVEDRAGD